MPTTRKKVIKTVYEDEDDSEAEKAAGDFSDSGSDAKITDYSTSEEEEESSDVSSDHDFDDKPKCTPSINNKAIKTIVFKNKKFAKQYINRMKEQASSSSDRRKMEEQDVSSPALFSVKDLTDAEKQLPSFLDLSESDSSDDEYPKLSKKNVLAPISFRHNADSDSEVDNNVQYKDVFSNNIKDSEEIAKKTFMDLEQHKIQIDKTKDCILNYESKTDNEKVSDIIDLLAQGEEATPDETSVNKQNINMLRDDSESEMDDWEEVNEEKSASQKGIQLIVDIPDAVVKKTKNVDVEMMMKRKMNRTKKEYQVYMHKVHVLCWLGHGNYVSDILNDQDVLDATLSLMPSKESLPGDRVDMAFVKEMVIWYKDKFTFNQDKNPAKFKPNAPSLKEILIDQIKSKTVTTDKYLVFIFVSLLRALGLQCRVVFNLVTLPIVPPTSHLYSLSMKSKDDNKVAEKANLQNKFPKSRFKDKIPQLDGNYDDNYSSDSDFENIVQLDGSNGNTNVKSSRITRSNKKIQAITIDDKEVTQAKRARKNPAIESLKSNTKTVTDGIQTRNSNKDKIKLPTDKKSTPKLSLSLDRKSCLNNDITNIKKIGIGTNNKPLLPSSPRTTRSSCNNDYNDTETKRLLRNSQSNIEDKLIKSKSPKITAASNVKKRLPTENSATKKNNENSSKTGLKTTNLTNVINGEKNLGSKKKSRNSPEKKSPKKRSLTANLTSLQNSDDINDEEDFSIKKKPKKGFNNAKSTKTRSMTANMANYETTNDSNNKEKFIKVRTKKTSGIKPTESELPLDDEVDYDNEDKLEEVNVSVAEDTHKLSNKELLTKTKSMSKIDFAAEIMKVIKNRVKEAKKGEESDEETVYLHERTRKRRNSDDDQYFKPKKSLPGSRSYKNNRPVLVLDDDELRSRTDVWCEVFVDELNQWITIDVIRGKVNCTEHIYSCATQPVRYVVGWDNSNYLKDVTRRYVPHWHTVTRKQRAEPAWWDEAARPWLAPRSARDTEEDEQLNRIHLEAPLPTTIGEYKNHPLYALKRHLLKFEAFYPPNPAILGFIRGEPVYARECVYVCRSRGKWYKEAKVVRPGEKPYKIVKTRKWDRQNRKPITNLPLEIFGPWQVQDYEPPTAENGIVPRNEYGNVELYKTCMLPKGTVLMKLDRLDKVAKKLNIDCAPAMIGFDNNTTWSQPLIDGYVVCKEFEEILAEAWTKNREEQERKEREKIETRVYSNWRRLVKALCIREWLEKKYGFEGVDTSKEQLKTKAKASR